MRKKRNKNNVLYLPVISGSAAHRRALSRCAEGGTLEDPAGFVKRLNQLMLVMGGE